MDLEQVVDDLTVLDFFKFVPPRHLNEARNRTLIALSERQPSLDFGCDWGPGLRVEEPWRGDRFFHVDAEGLAEGDVGDCLWRLIPLLALESVSIGFLADLQGWNDESGRTSYEIRVNDERHVVYDYGCDDDPDLWKLSHLATIRIINTLLERSGSQERAFGAASGNDASIYILTPALFEYIRQLPLHPAYVPVSDGELR